MRGGVLTFTHYVRNILIIRKNYEIFVRSLHAIKNGAPHVEKRCDEYI